MRYRPVNLIGGFNVDTAYPWAVEDTINYIPEKASSPFTRTPSKLRGAPGLRPYVQIAETGSPIRGSHNAEGRRFIVAGSTAYQITNAGVAIPLGTVPGVQRVNIAHNQIPGGNEIIITTGTPNSYVYNTVTQVFEKITDAGYPGAGSVDYIDTFLVQVEPFGRYWFWSAQADAMNYNTLDRAEAEASPDRIVGLAVNNFEVVVFGESTLEFFYNAGTVTGTFQSKRIWIQHGCAAAATIQKMDNTLYWLSPERILYRLSGYQAEPVSTPQFEEAISTYDLSTAFAFVYEDQGHKIYYLTFPGGKTFGFDVTTGLMHRRESYGLERWRLNTLEKWGDLWVGGDFQSGKLYTADWSYMLEGVDTPLVAERVSGVISSNQNNVTIPYVEVLVNSGQPETVAGETQFPVQPTGPTITGAAPDGAIGTAYAGYTYTLTGTAPLTVTLRSGTLPAGLSISTAGVIDTGTPTVLGSETFTLRVTDANGLWDELTDTIDIKVSLAIWAATAVNFNVRALIEVDQSTGQVAAIPYEMADRAYSSDGENFTIYTATNPTQPVGIAWSPTLELFCTTANGNNNRFYTSPTGAEWTLQTGVDPDNGNRSGMCWSPPLGEFATVQLEWLITSSNGTSWSAADKGLAGVEVIKWSNIVGGYITAGSKVFTSDATASTFTERTVTGIDYRDITESDTLIAMCCSDKVTVSTDGEAFTDHATPIDFECIEWVPFLGLFVAAGFDFAPKVYSSPDCVTWTFEAVLPDSAITVTPWDIAYSTLNNKIYIAGMSSTAGGGRIWVAG